MTDKTKPRTTVAQDVAALRAIADGAHTTPETPAEVLATCPFCGYHAHYDSSSDWVYCDGCGATGPTGDDQVSAIDAWNSRALPPIPVERIGRDGPVTVVDSVAAQRAEAEKAASSGAERPTNCRNALKDAGKAYPRSGCKSCGNGGLMGCPYDRKATPHVESRPSTVAEDVARLRAVVDGGALAAGKVVAEIVPCYVPSGKRVALNTEYQHLPIGTKLYLAPPADPAKKGNPLTRDNEESLMLALAEFITASAYPEDPRLEVAYAIARHLNLGWPAADPAKASGSAPDVPDAIRRAIMSTDLYGVLQDVQNGIDSPGLMSMANSAIRKIDAARDALTATPPASPVAEKPAYWEWRFFNGHPHTVDFGNWSEWERVIPRGCASLEDRLNELREYISSGKKYQLRALFGRLMCHSVAAELDGPAAYCRDCQAVGMSNCSEFDKCSGATCVTCHRPLNAATPPASVPEVTESRVIAAAKAISTVRQGNSLAYRMYMDDARAALQQEGKNHG